jgi:hypothetical protein
MTAHTHCRCGRPIGPMNERPIDERDPNVCWNCAGFAADRKKREANATLRSLAMAERMEARRSA